MADFNIVIKVDTSGATRKIKGVEQQLKRTETTANKVQKSMQRVFAGVTAGQGAVQSVRFLANFAQEMSTVKAISGATEKQFNDLRNAAIDLGTTTRFTATQAASGMLFLARSGYETQQILEAIPGVLNLAQAGALDLGRAADIATNILKGFGLSTAETGRVVDVLAEAANSANTTVEQLGQAMKFVAPIGAGVRLSLEDTTAAIQALSNAGIQASMAGTGLRRVIGALEGPTKTQEKLLNSLGLTTDDVKVSQVGLVKALERIKGRTNDVGIMLQLFGQRGGPAAEVMGKMTDEIIQFGKENTKSAGTAQRIADIMDDNLNGAILRVKSAFQGFLIQLGDVEVVQRLRDFLEGLTLVFRFFAKNAEGASKAIKASFIAIGVGFAIFKVQALLAARAAAVTAGEVHKLNIAFATNPAITLLTIITALIVAFTLMKDELHIAGNELVTLGGIMEVTADFINDAWRQMTGGMAGDIINLKDGWTGLMENMITTFLATALGLAKGADFIIGSFKGMWAALKLIGLAIKQSYDKVWKAIGNKAIDIIGGTLNYLISKLNDLRTAIGMTEIPELDLDYLKNPQLKKEAEVSGAQIGAAFVAALGETANQDVLTGIMDETERRALEEMRRLGRQADPEPEVTPPPPDIFSDLVENDGGRSKLKPKFGELAALISQETWLLKHNSREMEIQERLIDLNDKVRGGLNEKTEIMAENMLRELQLRREMAQVYDEIKGPMEDVMASQAALIQLYREGTITLEEYIMALDKLKLTSLALNTDMESGFARGLIRVKMNMVDLATTAESIVGKAFSGMSDAIGDFVTNTETDFSGMVDAILRDLTKLLIQKALLSAVMGGGGATIPIGNPGAYGPAFASGGSFMVGGAGGTDSQQVAFQASPNERVTVETPAQQRESDSGGGQNITIVNVTDPDEIPEAMAGRDGEKVILNVITKNRNVVRNSIA